MAKTYKTRPSELLDLEDPHDAFRLDRAVWFFGSSLSAELQSVKGKTDREIERRQDRILQKWIPQTTAAKKFKEPPVRKGR